MGSFGIGVWKYIRRGWVTFSKFVRYEADNRPKVRFFARCVVWGTIVKDILFGLV
jgi:hypothetical protein